MNLKKTTALLMSVLMLLVALAGCQPADEEGGAASGGSARENIEATLAKFPMATTNTAAGVGGVLKYAAVSSSPFKGLFDPVLYQDAIDSTVMSFMLESFLSTDENLTFSQEGICTYTYDLDAKSVTLTMKPNVTVKWHDGEPATLDDLLFAYEVVCHPDYTGVRYDASYMNIVGAEEYHTGAADTISGLTLSADEKSLTIQFKEFFPSILIAGFNSSPIPRHYYAGVEVKDLEASAQVRERPIGFGPFKIKTIVPGESVEYVRFDDYWRGAPKLEGIIVEIIESSMVPTAMEEGRYDIASFSVAQYADYQNPTNYTYLSSVSRAYSYTGFRLGTYDFDKGLVVPDPTRKMWDINLRKAIGYAVDNQTICDTFYNGLRFAATSIICPFHPGYIDYDVPGYLYNPELAKKTLDDAGYKDVDGDGFREDPNGNQLTITWATMEGENQENIAQFKIQCWADVGLRVELFNGRLTEFNAFYDFIQNDTDDKVIDMYDGAWSVGYDPNPASLYGPEAVFNFPRYTSERFEEIIGNISSEKAWDGEWLAQQYKDWQQAFNDEIPVIPTIWRLELVAVNNRVKNYSLERKDGVAQVSLGASHLWEITSANPATK